METDWFGPDILYFGEAYGALGTIAQVPVWLKHNSETPLSGLVSGFGALIEEGEYNPEEALSFSPTGDINVFQANDGNDFVSVLLTEVPETEEGTTLLLGYLEVEIPGDIEEGSSLTLTTRGASGSGPEYELITVDDLTGEITMALQSDAITFMANWNLMSFDIELIENTPEIVFFDLIETVNLIYVTGFVNGEAGFFDPNGLPFLNTLNTLEPGYGYWVKIQYPAPSGEMAKQIVRNVNNDIIRTNVFMFISGSVILKDIALEENDKVKIYTESGMLVGEMDIVEGTYLRTGAVYGDDRITEEIDGAMDGEKLIFRYNDIDSEPVDIHYTGNMELSKVDLVFRNIPETFTLHQNFPNPFNPITTLRYDLSSDGLVILSIYDMLGKEITQLVNITQEAGFKSVQWNANASMGRPGVYLCQFQAGEFVQTKKMVLVK
jgi:hypothetical protein